MRQTQLPRVTATNMAFSSTFITSPFGLGTRSQQQIEFIGREIVSIKPASRILQSGLALIGEIHVAIGGEEQVIRTLETFAPTPADDWGEFAALRVQEEDTVFVVGDEYASVVVNLKSVRFAVILRDQRELTLWRDTKDAAVGNVDNVEVAVTVK